MRMFLALEITFGNIAVNVLKAPKSQAWLQFSCREGYANTPRQQRCYEYGSPLQSLMRLVY